MEGPSVASKHRALPLVHIDRQGPRLALRGARWGAVQAKGVLLRSEERYSFGPLATHISASQLTDNVGALVTPVQNALGIHVIVTPKRGRCGVV